MHSARGHGLLIGLASAVLALGLWFGHALDGWENTTWSWRARALAQPASPEVVLILLDQASLDWGEQENGLPWPWPREVYAPILDFCARGGARVVAFDVLFSEPSVYGVSDDQTLAAAITRAGEFVGARFLKIDPDTRQPVGSDEPIDEVANAAGVLANVSEVPDSDGVFRRATPMWRWQGSDVPSLGVAAWVAGQTTGTDLQGDVHRPVLLRFRDPDQGYQSYSAAAVIQSELRLAGGEAPTIDPGLLRDKYVLFGFSAPGLLDQRPTPVSRVNPGVVVHATMLDNLLRGDFMRAAVAWETVLGVLLLGLLAGWLGGTGRWLIPVAVGLLALPVALGFAAYGAGLWWPVVPGLLAVAVALFGSTVRNYAVEGRQKRFIKQAFRHYLSPAVIEKIMVEPDALQLGGERRELTIMFSDLEGFTSLSEGLDPTELTSLLNDYLTDMTDIILAAGGTLDKYEGDAILAFWNAPLDQPDHAARACRAAVLCQQKLTARAGDFAARCGRPLRARIGLHTGPVIVGNMGSRQRFDYTVLGDAANLASRLEGANKAFGTAVMISEATLAAAGDGFVQRPLGPIRVVGRREAVEVFELTGLAGEAAPDSWAGFAEALAVWRAGDTARARQMFAAVTDDPAAAGCAELKGDDGVWVLDAK